MFQSPRAIAEKSLSPSVFSLVCGTTIGPWSCDLNDLLRTYRCWISEMHVGAWSFKALLVRTKLLKCILECRESWMNIVATLGNFIYYGENTIPNKPALFQAYFILSDRFYLSDFFRSGHNQTEQVHNSWLNKKMSSILWHTYSLVGFYGIFLLNKSLLFIRFSDPLKRWTETPNSPNPKYINV